MAEYIKLNGTMLPKPKIGGLRLSHNKIWSSSTGRVNTGEMTGTIVAIKKKIEIQFPPLRQSQVNTIKSVVNSMTPFMTVEYSLNSGESGSFTAYTGDLELSLGWDNPTWGTRYDDVELSIVEK